MGWYEEALVYQIYPLGCVGAPWDNDGVLEHRILQLASPAWLDHLEELGVTCVLLNPVMESESHGYDVRDYYRCDPRLGTADDLRAVVDAYHARGMRVLFDGVFNHVGRNFAPFQDVLSQRERSRYAGWFHVNFGGDNVYGDHLSYDTWAGCSNIVKLNLGNDEVRNYLYDVVRSWVRDYDIDGLRLDVAYCLDRGFLAGLRAVANGVKPEFVLVGETLFGDYNPLMNDHACHSVTNYECYKGLWSSVLSRNLHEVLYAFKRQGGRDPWCLYTGKHLLDFLDNHDVDRIATKIQNKTLLFPLYGLLLGMPGVPCLYYGSEWGVEGENKPYQHELRPAFPQPEWNVLCDWISLLASAYRELPALAYGDYDEVLVQPAQCVFARSTAQQRVLVTVNIDPEDATYRLNGPWAHGTAVDALSGKEVSLEDGLVLPAQSCQWLVCS